LKRSKSDLGESNNDESTARQFAFGDELEQIRMLLGDISSQTTERHLGSKQCIRFAINDRIGIEPAGAGLFSLKERRKGWEQIVPCVGATTGSIVH
jgi:hypothetical protein